MPSLLILQRREQLFLLGGNGEGQCSVADPETWGAKVGQLCHWYTLACQTEAIPFWKIIWGKTNQTPRNKNSVNLHYFWTRNKMVLHSWPSPQNACMSMLKKQIYVNIFNIKAISNSFCLKSNPLHIHRIQNETEWESCCSLRIHKTYFFCYVYFYTWGSHPSENAWSSCTQPFINLEPCSLVGKCDESSMFPSAFLRFWAWFFDSF